MKRFKEQEEGSFLHIATGLVFTVTEDKHGGFSGYVHALPKEGAWAETVPEVVELLSDYIEKTVEEHEDEL